ncbi:hypothetical protein ACVIRO_001251 [Rhizobium ruizarguesonis]
MARRVSPSQTLPYPISSVANGVSQQAPTLRLPNQVEEALNIRSTVLGGVGPRSGSYHRGKYPLGSTTPANALGFKFDRGDDGKYAGIATKEGLRIFNLDTFEEAAVSYPNGSIAFFSSLADPKADLSFVSAGNYLFFANQKKTVAMDAASKTAAPVNEAFVFCKASSYDQRVTISLTNQVTSAVSTWIVDAPKTAGAIAVALNNTNTAAALGYTMVNNASQPFASQGVSASNQSWVLASGTGTAGAAGYTVQTYKNIIRVTRSDGADFALDIIDASGVGSNIAGINKAVKQFSDLPAVFWPGSIIRVFSQANDSGLDYWVSYTQTDEAGKQQSGYWKEVPAPDTEIAFDPTTMPYGLVMNSRNVFTFDKVTWDKRKAGSAITLPPPSFVGSSVTGLYFMRSRLGIVMSDGTVTSRSDDNPFNFWRQSSVQQLDTDPIDKINGTEEVVDIHGVCLVGQTPVLFSSTRQLALIAPQGATLSPNAADLRAVSSFQTPGGAAKPHAYGTTAFFATPGTFFSGVSQFSLNTDSNDPTGDSNPVTDHVPAYIPADVWQFESCTSENMLFSVAGADRNLIFAYQFLDTTDNGRVQSAWAKWAWDESCAILSLAIFNKLASMVIARPDGIFLEQMDLSADRLVGPFADDLVLDRQHVPAIDVDPMDNWTYIIPVCEIEQDDGPGWYVVTRDAFGKIDQIYQCSWRSKNLMKVNVNLTGKDYIVGRAPRCFLQLSEPVARPPGSSDSIYADVTMKKVGPVFGQSSGCVMRIAYKSRRHYGKLLQVGQSLRWDGQPEIEMFKSQPITPASGEYVYIFQSQPEDTAPKRYVSAGGKTTDVLISFENNGPRTFKVVGAVYILSVTPKYTGQ